VVLHYFCWGFVAVRILSCGIAALQDEAAFDFYQFGKC